MLDVLVDCARSTESGGRELRILQVIHDYLPLHSAGSEIYTANLCRALVNAGHEVAVFTCEERRDLPQYELLEREYEGIPVYEAIYNRIYHDLSEQWDDPQMARVFESVLDRFNPDVIHVQGLQFVGGVSSLEAAAARTSVVLMTLHEYWWLCSRSGLMFDLKGNACEEAVPSVCADCVDIYPIDRERWSDDSHGNSYAELGDRRWFARALEGRKKDMDAAYAHVDKFIAPSKFLARRFENAGMPPEKLVVADYGFPDPAARSARAPASVPLHFGYVGTLSDYKGVETFARAVELSGLSGEQLQARIYGHLDWFPDVAARLEEIAERTPPLLLKGPFSQEDREEVFAALDVLVVPSLWWENSPLTIHEAFQRGMPVLTSDRGGMAELVAQGGGLTFPPGDAEALAGLLKKLCAQPSKVDDLAAGIPAVRGLSEDVALVERLTSEAGHQPHR
ncbi:MAG: glycosyltransferase family 4 protein [Planctomycetota bacterium]|jgi:glycosyltransferase involved in cell wall biosynthesis|nr:glycosyltransferase family 4 protein [Planctomycetota bacterium]